MLNGFYHLTKNGLRRISDFWPTILMIMLVSFFLGVYSGYGWKTMQLRQEVMPMKSYR